MELKVKLLILVGATIASVLWFNLIVSTFMVS